MFSNMLGALKKSFSSLSKKAQSFEYKNLAYISLFLVVVLVFWRYIVSLFKPADDARAQTAAVTQKNNEFKASGSITADGRFITGNGVVTKYNITGARRDAESLAALMNTYKGAKWYSVTLSFFGLGSITKIKAILNPNYPASYRRYVSKVYTDVYTNYKGLQTDVRSALTGFAGSSYWTIDLDKYFTF